MGRLRQRGKRLEENDWLKNRLNFTFNTSTPRLNTGVLVCCQVHEPTCSMARLAQGRLQAFWAEGDEVSVSVNTDVVGEH